MRKFLASCIDNKTKKEIVFSECSFNSAMFELEVNGFDITSVKVINGIHEINANKNNKTIKFYYDEERGYLLKD